MLMLKGNCGVRVQFASEIILSNLTPFVHVRTNSPAICHRDRRISPSPRFSLINPLWETQNFQLDYEVFGKTVIHPPTAWTYASVIKLPMLHSPKLQSLFFRYTFDIPTRRVPCSSTIFFHGSSSARMSWSAKIVR